MFVCVRERVWDKVRLVCVCVCNQQWNIAKFLYYWHSPHCLAWGKVSFIPKGKPQTKSKSNKHNKTHWYSPGGHVMGLWRLRINQACHTDPYLSILRPHRRPSIHSAHLNTSLSISHSTWICPEQMENVRMIECPATLFKNQGLFWQSFGFSFLKKMTSF